MTIKRFIYGNSRIARKFIIAIVLFSSVLTLIATGLQLFVDYNKDIKAIRQELVDIEVSHGQSLSTDIWQFDEQSLQLQLKGILALPSINTLRLERKDAPDFTVGKSKGRNLISHAIPLNYTHRGKTVSLGTLHMTASYDSVMNRLQERFWFILITQFVLIFCVSAFLFFLFYYLVERHLKVIATHTAALNSRNLDVPLQLDRQACKIGKDDELDQMVEAVNAMQMRLSSEIVERKSAVEELRETQELFTLFMKYSPIYTFIKQIEGEQSRVIQASDNFIKMTGISADKLRGRTMYELFPPDFARKITEDDIAVVTNGKVIQLEEELDGLKYTTIKFPIFREGKNDLIAGFTIDITELKRVEEERQNVEKQLLYAQKLESLGVLAGGIAHDFNNILMAIMGNADLALMRINKESPAVDNLHRIEQAAARAADLAKQMLAYSGKGKFVVEQLNMNCLLEEMLHMLEVSISKKAVLRFNLHSPLPTVEADATQMRQIIMNLAINASEAIGDKSGVIAVTTGCMDCDRTYLKDVWLDENLIDGLYVYLEIADTGCGMDKETMAKLFDPFFTTKFTGRGLGMAAVLGIVRGHKGAIKVYSEPHKGTTFKVLLPASNRPAELFNGHIHKDDWRGTGTVLIVDDEETVRGLGAEMLKELGFSPVTANDGREALAAFKSNPSIELVILDLTMPHMDGEQCFRELRLLKPDVKVIMSSGYNEQEVTQKFVGKGLAGFIQKPYKLSVLREAIRSVSEGHG